MIIEIQVRVLQETIDELCKKYNIDKSEVREIIEKRIGEG